MKSQKNYPAVIFFFVALVSGPCAFFSVLGNDLPRIVSISIITYIFATIAVFYFDNIQK
jgi:hypothetical protein